MGIIKEALFKITKDERLLIDNTDNGLQPDDPEQDVDQSTTYEWGDDDGYED